MVPVQEYSFQLLKELDELCRNNDITYYLAGGSVIGALRHKGFIPWDDDVDIYMTRDNWKKFKVAFKKDHVKGRELVCSEDCTEFANMIARYVSTETTAVYRSALVAGKGSGMILDVLILDPVPDDEAKIEEHIKTLMLYSEIVNPFYIYSHRLDHEVPYQKYLTLQKVIGKRQVLNIIEKKLTQYKDEDCSKYVLRWGGIPHVFEKSMLGTPRYVEYEGVKLPVLEKSNKYLTQLYGEDWAYIPPHDEEITHVGIWNVESPYQAFFDEFHPLINKKKLTEAAIKRKMSRLESGGSYKDIQTISSKLHASKAVQNIERLEKEYDFQSLYEAKDYEKLDELFGEYWRVQCTTNMLGNKFFGGYYRYLHPILVPIEDRLLTIAIDVLMWKGISYRARRIIEARKQQGGELTPELQLQEKCIALQVLATDHYEQRELDQALQLVEEGMKLKPEWVNFYKLRCLIAMLQNDWDVELKYAQLGAQLRPNDGDWKKYQGDAAAAKGQHAEARKLYVEARNTTQNGNSLLLIGEYFQEYWKELEAQLEKMRAQDDWSGMRSLLEDNREIFEEDKPFIWYDVLVQMHEFEEKDELFKLLLAIRVNKNRFEIEKRVSLLGEGWRIFGLSEQEIEDRKKMYQILVEKRTLSKQELEEIKIDTSIMAMKNLADYYLYRGKYKAAYEYYHQILENDDIEEIVKYELVRRFKKDIKIMCTALKNTSKKNRKEDIAAWQIKYPDTEQWLRELDMLGIERSAKVDVILEVLNENS